MVFRIMQNRTPENNLLRNFRTYSGGACPRFTGQENTIPRPSNVPLATGHVTSNNFMLFYNCTLLRGFITDILVEAGAQEN
jgi:hypothetical protein